MRRSVERWRPWLVALVALVALLVAGCGSAGATGGGASSGAGSGGGPPGQTLPCDGSLGAPGGTPSATLRSTDVSHAATAPAGSVIEIRLDGQHVWKLGTVTPTSALTPVQAQGALEQGDCVWDFQVAQAGDAVVAFTGTALCQPTQACPQYALLARFTIHGV
jgi:hypothetical protein